MGVDDDRRDDEYACRRACRHDVVVVGWSLIALRLVDLGMDHGGWGVLPYALSLEAIFGMLTSATFAEFS
jgi:hypothetical protein